MKAPSGPRADELWTKAVNLLACYYDGLPDLKGVDAFFEDVELEPCAVADAYRSVHSAPTPKTHRRPKSEIDGDGSCGDPSCDLCWYDAPVDESTDDAQEVMPHAGPLGTIPNGPQVTSAGDGRRNSAAEGDVASEKPVTPSPAVDATDDAWDGRCCCGQVMLEEGIEGALHAGVYHRAIGSHETCVRASDGRRVPDYDQSAHSAGDGA